MTPLYLLAGYLVASLIGAAADYWVREDYGRDLRRIVDVADRTSGRIVLPLPLVLLAVVFALDFAASPFRRAPR